MRADPKYPPDAPADETEPGRYDDDSPYTRYPAPLPLSASPFRIHLEYIERIAEAPWSKDFRHALKVLSAAGRARPPGPPTNCGAFPSTVKRRTMFMQALDPKHKTGV